MKKVSCIINISLECTSYLGCVVRDIQCVHECSHQAHSNHTNYEVWVSFRTLSMRYMLARKAACGWHGSLSFWINLKDFAESLLHVTTEPTLSYWAIRHFCSLHQWPINDMRNLWLSFNMKARGKPLLGFFEVMVIWDYCGIILKWKPPLMKVHNTNWKKRPKIVFCMLCTRFIYKSCPKIDYSKIKRNDQYLL